MARIDLSPPWAIHYNELKAMFGGDKIANVIYDPDNKKIKLYVRDNTQAEALELILKTELEGGWKVEIIPGNCSYSTMIETTLDSPLDAIKKAFDYTFYGSAVMCYTELVSGLFSNDLLYIVFRPEVVQYYNDSLGDIHGLCSTLYQDIAKDIFKPMDGVFYCTDKIDNKYY